MSLIITKIATIFVMVFIGYMALKLGAVKEEANEYLINLMLNITGPCMLVTSIADKDLNESMVTATIEMIIGMIVFFIVGYFISIGIVRMMKVPREDEGLATMMMTSKNTGFMGFPVAKGAFGNEGLYFMVLSNIMMNIYIYSFGIAQVNSGGNRKVSLGETIKSVINPCSVAAITGVVLLFLQVKIPDFISEIMVPMGNATIPVSMIALGIQLGKSNLKEIIRNGKLALMCIVSLTVIPAMTFLAVNWLPLYPFVKLTLIYGAAFPSMVMVIAISEKEKLNTRFAAETVALTTLFSVVTLPVTTILLSMIYL